MSVVFIYAHNFSCLAVHILTEIYKVSLFGISVCVYQKCLSIIPLITFAIFQQLTYLVFLPMTHKVNVKIQGIITE